MIELGFEVKDRVSGYTGIVVSRTEFLNGCKRLGVQRRWKPTFTALEDPVLFDESDLTIVGNGVTTGSDVPKKPRYRTKPTEGDPKFRIPTSRMKR